jgi:alcohol dehydrogenase
MAVEEYGRPLVERAFEPEPLRPGTARIQILTCGVCFSDVKTSRGQMPFSAGLELPHVPGHEICARVVETDPPGAPPEGTTVAVYHYWPCGVCYYCRAGDETLCLNLEAWMGFTHPGGFQDELVVPLDRLLLLPDGIDPIQAAPMTCAIGTAYRAIVTRGGVRAGMSVGVIGVGGVGIHALQIARAAGAHAVGFDFSNRALAVCGDLGLTALRADDEASVAESVAATDGGGFDIVVNTVGATSAFEQSCRIVRKGGRVVGVGYSGSSSLSMASARFVLDEIECVGSRYASRGELGRAIALVAAGAVKPVVDMVRPLEAVNEVFEALERGEIVGRAVLELRRDQ